MIVTLKDGTKIEATHVSFIDEVNLEISNWGTNKSQIVKIEDVLYICR